MAFPTGEAAEYRGLYRAGLAADVVVHELSNVLNALLLQTAVLQQKSDEPLRSELKAVCDQGRTAVDLMRRLQRYGRDSRPASSAVDLNRVVRAAASGVPNACLDLSPDLPHVRGSSAELEMLTTLLLRNAAAVTPEDEAVRVRTERGAGAVRLHVEDGGPPVTPELLSHLFDLTAAGREGVEPLELAACQLLVRRLEGVIHGENRAGGVVLVVELPPHEGAPRSGG
jgi:signal transduction histidine kinase